MGEVGFSFLSSHVWEKSHLDRVPAFPHRTLIQAWLVAYTPRSPTRCWCPVFLRMSVAQFLRWPRVPPVFGVYREMTAILALSHRSPIPEEASSRFQRCLPSTPTESQPCFLESLRNPAGAQPPGSHSGASADLYRLVISCRHLLQCPCLRPNSPTLLTSHEESSLPKTSWASKGLMATWLPLVGCFCFS